jgi:hypothetical protein
MLDDLWATQSDLSGDRHVDGGPRARRYRAILRSGLCGKMVTGSGVSGSVVLTVVGAK